LGKPRSVWQDAVWRYVVDTELEDGGKEREFWRKEIGMAMAGK